MRQESVEPRLERVARTPMDTSSGGWRFARLLLPCLLGLATLTGCCGVRGARLTDWWCNGFKVGPNYSRPAAPVASQWVDYADPRGKSEAQQRGPWGAVF